MDPRTRGEQARRLLEDEVLQEAFAEVEQNLRQRWEASTFGAVDAREACYHLHCALAALKAQLTSYWTTAKLTADRGEA
jgi:hypothetical protein